MKNKNYEKMTEKDFDEVMKPILKQEEQNLKDSEIYEKKLEQDKKEYEELMKEEERLDEMQEESEQRLRNC